MLDADLEPFIRQPGCTDEQRKQQLERLKFSDVLERLYLHLTGQHLTAGPVGALSSSLTDEIIKIENGAASTAALSTGWKFTGETDGSTKEDGKDS